MLPFVFGAALSLVLQPTAIVDSVSGTDAVRPLQLLAPGTEIVLEDGARVRLAYFASCVHETARHGRLRVGVTASLSADAAIERVTADCLPPRYGPAQAEVPYTLRARSPGAAVGPVRRVRSRSPLLVAEPHAQLLLTRMQPGGRSVFLPAGAGTVDLAAAGIRLEPGALYLVCDAESCGRLWVDPDVNHESGPVLERVVRVP